MEIILFSDDEKIKVLFDTIKLIRAVPDTPLLWKFNLEYMDLLCSYMHICSHESLLEHKFLDANIEVTTLSPYCVCINGLYPLLRK